MKRSRDRPRSCLGKQTYRTLKAAQTAADELARAMIFYTGVMAAYRCRYGTHYHYGNSMSQGEETNGT